MYTIIVLRNHTQIGDDILAKHEGRCALCGKHTELTFEHVPPKAAFNKDRVKSYSLLDSINDKDRLPWDVSGVPYTSLQKGSGFYSLCKECNNNTGALYGNAYRSMAYSIAHALSEHDETTHHAITLTKVPAHQFIKQILSMFCSLNGYDVVERFPHPNVLINPERLSPIQKTIYESTAAIYHAAHAMDSIRNFVLDPSACGLDNRFHLYMYFSTDSFIRCCPFNSVMNLEDGTYTIVSELTVPPFGFSLYFNPSPDANYPGINISEFASYSYNQLLTCQMPMIVKERNTYFPMDYRSKEEILQCIEDTNSRNH